MRRFSALFGLDLKETTILSQIVGAVPPAPTALWKTDHNYIGDRVFECGLTQFLFIIMLFSMNIMQ
jgi:hypothetical protein